jgi:hypothetical protein
MEQGGLKLVRVSMALTMLDEPKEPVKLLVFQHNS